VVGLPSLLTDSILAFDVDEPGAGLENSGLAGLAASSVCALALCTFFLPTASKDEVGGGDSKVGEGGGDVIFLILRVRVRRSGMLIAVFRSILFGWYGRSVVGKCRATEGRIDARSEVMKLFVPQSCFSRTKPK
jgi:hypothetical protein